jgi:hypothetical protein
MATIDKIKQGNNTKKKPTGMASAVSSTEKIRTWVSINSSMNTFRSKSM